MGVYSETRAVDTLRPGLLSVVERSIHTNFVHACILKSLKIDRDGQF